MTEVTKRPLQIAPERIYPRRAFQEASSIAITRIREARLQGVDLPTIDVGKRTFALGSVVIQFISRLSQLGNDR